MSAPQTLAKIKSMCHTIGLTDVQLTPGAATADRPGTFDPHSCTIHITAGGLGARTEQQYIADIIDGDKEVPLKANAVVAPDGTLWLNAQGNSNHALYYGAKAYDAALNATFPLTGSVDYRGWQTKWSLLAYGCEMIAATGAKVTSAQRRAAIGWAAAICILHGWTGQETHGHGEVSGDRSPLPDGDPGIDMGRFRRDVMTVVKARSLDTIPITTNPGLPQEEDMPLTKADVMTIAATDNVFQNPNDPNADNKFWTLNSIVGYAARHSGAADAKASAALKAIGGLSGQLAALTNLIKQLQAGSEIDYDKVEAAAEAGNLAALQKIVTDVKADVVFTVDDSDGSAA